MSSDRVLDYLTEELVVAKNIVTYRSLSHALRIHVNHAKNELAVYHSEHAGSSDAGYATYVIGGEPLVSYLDSVRDTDKMAVDDEEMDEDSEDVPETKITLVREADLETSKEQYARIHFVHIYSLSPSPIHEPALLCEPAKNLRDAGKSIAAGFTVALGRITGPDWYIKKRTDLQQQRRSSTKAKPSATATTSTSKNRLPGLSKAPSMIEDAKPVVKSEPKDVKPQIKEEPAKQAKPSGKLDFSKAKAKPPAAPASAPKAAPETRKIKAEPVEEPLQAAPKPERKLSRSKDKSMSKLSDSDEEAESVTATARTRAAKSPSTSKRVESTKSAERVRRRVVISDDDEDEDEEAPKPSKPPPPRAKAAYKSKARAKTKDTSPGDPEAEKELRAMMDIDDDQVTRVSHTPVSISESATSPPATDVEMEDREPEPEPEPARARAPTRKKTQRKPKKEVPVGRNGLKKRRVVKSRMTTDEKGYFVTEDYSSYESVDEEEAPPAEKSAKGKGKKKITTAPIKVKDEEEAEEATAKEKEKAAKPLARTGSTLKRKPSKPSVQKGGIASYFNKK